MVDDQDRCDWVNVSFLYRLTRVDADKGPYNGCCCVVVVVQQVAQQIHNKSNQWSLTL